MFSCSHQCQRMFINFPHISKEIETPHVHHYVHHFSPCFHQFSEKNHLQHVQFSSHVQISKCLEFQNVTQISIYIYKHHKTMYMPNFFTKVPPISSTSWAGASRRRDLEQCGGRGESQQWWSPMGAESWVARHEGVRNDNEWIIYILWYIDTIRNSSYYLDLFSTHISISII